MTKSGYTSQASAISAVFKSLTQTAASLGSSGEPHSGKMPALLPDVLAATHP